MDRTVVVRLVGMVGQYRSAMAQAITATRAVTAATNDMTRASIASASATNAAARAQAGAMSGMASSMRSMRGMLLGLGLPLAIGALAKSFLDFEQKMAHVKAVADDFGRSATGMKALTTAALEAGQAYGFTAVEVAEAQEALLKAGRTTAQVLGGELNAALTLAAAGTISLDQAATITATTMTIFREQGIGAAHVANQLTGAANETVSGVLEMGSALSYVGPVAASLGVSFEETVATISVFNQAGIEAERAGTNLRGMLTNLLSPSAMAKAEMVRLGISLNDSNGKFIGLAGTAQVLHDRLNGLSDAEKAVAVGRLTTNASMPGFIVLMRGGAAVVQQMEKAIRDSATAEQVAAEKLDSVTGEFQKFGAAVSTAAIKVGGALEPALSAVARTLTGVAKGFGDMGGASQLALVALAAQLLMARRLHGAYTTARTSARDLAAAQVRLNNMTGGRGTSFVGPLGRDGTMIRDQMAQATSMQRVMAETRASVMTATSAWGRFEARGVGAFRAIGAAGRGLVGFMGGGWGVAFAGVMAGLAMWQAEVARSKRVSDNLRSGIQLLGLEFVETGKVSDSAMREMFKSNPEMAWMLEHTDALGVSMRDLAEAAGGDAKAVTLVSASLDDYASKVEGVRDELSLSVVTHGLLSRAVTDLTDDQRRAVEELNVPVREAGWIGGVYNGQLAATSERLKAVAERARKAAEAYREQHKSELALIAAQKEMAKANLDVELAKMGISAENASIGLKMMGDNLAVINSQDADFNDRMKAMAENIGMLTSAFYSAASAMGAFYSASQEKLARAFTEDIPAGERGTGGGGTGGGVPKYGTTRTWDEDVDEKGKRTRRDVATTRKPDGTTVVSTTTTGPDGKKTTETRKSFDAADARQPEEKKAPTTRKIAPQISEITGQFDVITEKGRAQHDAMVGMAESTAKAAEQVMATVSKAGMETPQAFAFAGEIAVAEFVRMRETAVKSLREVGMSAKDAQAIVEAYYPTAEAFATSIGHAGAEKLVANLRAAGVEVHTLANGGAAFVASSKAAADELALLGGKVSKMKDGRFKVIFTNRLDAEKALETLSMDRETRIKVIADAKHRKETEDQLAKLRRDRLARVLADADKEHRDAANAQLNAVAKDRVARIKVVPYDATAPKPGYDYFGNPIKGVPKGAQPFSLGNPAAFTNPLGALGPVLGLRRWGGISAATGSLRDAMIAGPGTRYQWAEPETGGEAFIPRHGKQDRSMGILSKAAAWYGAKVTPASSGPAWGNARLQSAGSQQVQITVRGEGVLSGMIEATVDGRLVKVAQTVANGRVR
jgi:TP901 family phage tail tape measure protein